MGNNLKNERKYIRKAVEAKFDMWLEAVRELPLKRRLRIAISLVFPFVTVPKVTIAKR